MYVIPLALLILVAAGIFFSPILAGIVLIVFLLGLGLYKFVGPGTEPEHSPTSETPAVATQVRSGREETEGGVWGEKWPEQSQEEPTS